MEVDVDLNPGFTFAGGDRADAPSRVSFEVESLNYRKIEVYLWDRPSPVLLGKNYSRKCSRPGTWPSA
eukprot:5241931-Pyramimonas_sp.AAC.1